MDNRALGAGVGLGSRVELEGMVRDMVDRRLAGSGPWQAAHGRTRDGPLADIPIRNEGGMDYRRHAPYPVSCFNCGQVGHLPRRCRAPCRERPRPPRPPTPPRATQNSQAPTPPASPRETNECRTYRAVFGRPRWGRALSAATGHLLWPNRHW